MEAPFTMNGSAMKMRIGREMTRAITMTSSHSLNLPHKGELVLGEGEEEGSIVAVL